VRFAFGSPNFRKFAFYSALIGISGFVIIAVSVAVAANSFVNAANALSDIPADELVAPSAEQQSEVDSAFLRLNKASIKLDRWMSPVRVLSRLAGWIPVVGDHVEAGVLLGDIAVSMELTVSEFRVAGSGLAPLLADFRSPSKNDSSRSILDKLEQGVELDGSAVIRASDAAEVAIDAVNRLDELSLIGPMQAAADKASVNVDRADSLVTAVIAFEELLESTSLLIEDLKWLSDHMPTETTGFDEISNVVPVVTRTAAAAHAAEQNITVIGSEFGKIGANRQIEELLEEINDGIRAVALITDGLATLLGLVDAVSNALASADGPIVQKNGALPELIDLLNSNQIELSDAVAKLSDGVTAFESPNLSSWKTALFGDRAGQLEKVEELQVAAETLVSIPKVFSYLLGLDEPRTILLLGQSADELRGAGGFTSSVWIVQTSGGGIERTSLVQAGKFDNPDLLGNRPPTPDDLSKYMDAGAWYLRDVGWSPNFPDVARAAVGMFESDNRPKPAAVISINQWAYVKLANALGGLRSSDGVVRSEDVMAIIEEDTDLEGTGSLISLWDLAIGALTAESVGDRPLEFMLLWRDLINTKDLMIWAADEGVQSQLHRNGWVGELSLDSGSKIAVVDSNVGWNKTDRNVVRSVNYEIDLRELSAITASYELSYENNAEIGNDCSFHGRPVGAESSYENLKNSCYWNFFRLYLPIGAAAISWDKLPLPEVSVPAKSGTILAGFDTVELGFDTSGNYLGGLLATEPGTTGKFGVQLQLPSSVVELDNDNLSHTVDLWAQSGSQGRMIDMVIKLPAGYEPTAMPEGATYAKSTNIISYATRLTSDEQLTFTAIHK
jgi:hypothetical protein